jgi:hypothetical protein
MKQKERIEAFLGIFKHKSMQPNTVNNKGTHFVGVMRFQTIRILLTMQLLQWLMFEKGTKSRWWSMQRIIRRLRQKRTVLRARNRQRSIKKDPIHQKIKKGTWLKVTQVVMCTK